MTFGEALELANGIVKETTAKHGLEPLLFGGESALVETDGFAHTPVSVEALHVRSITARRQGLFEGGQRVKHLVQTVDFMPTALELAGVEDEDIWSHMHGKSLTRALGDEPVREFALAELQKPLEPFHWVKREHPHVDIRQWNRHLKSARTHEWKYIWASDGRDELYHVAEDPDEQKNLIAERPEVAADLYEKMEDLLLSLDRRDYGDCLKLTGHVTVDPDVAARLEAWGLYRRVIGANRKE